MAKSLYERSIKLNWQEIEDMARSGCTDEDIALAIGIAVRTLQKYKREHDELDKMLTVARRKSIVTVKNALWRAAVGYDYEEKKKSIRKDDKGVEQSFVEIYTKKAHPNPAAIQMFLRNNDRQYIDHDFITMEQRVRELDLREKALSLKDIWGELDDDNA